MTYDEWLNNIEELKNSNNYAILEKLEKESLNENINHMIEPKLIKLISDRLIVSLNKLTNNLLDIYTDPYKMDMVLVTFRKDIDFSLRLLKLKQISSESYKDTYEGLKSQVNESFSILEKEAVNIDSTGNLMMIIRNNRIKWSE